MFGRLRRARLKAAETALAEARLDEAYRLAISEDLAQESRAKDVLASVGQLLFDRAEDHFKQGRFAEALIDLDHASRAGVESKRVEDLRKIVQAAVQDRVKRQDVQEARIRAAKDRIASGSLRAAVKILDRAQNDDSQVRVLQKQIDGRRERGQEMLAEVRQYIDKAQWNAAIQRFHDAKKLSPKDPQIAQCEQALVDKVLSSTREALLEGRLSRAFDELRLLSGIGDDQPAKREILDVLETVTEVGRAIHKRDYELARRRIGSIDHVLKEAKWLGEIANQLKQLDELALAVLSSPFGQLSDRHADAYTYRRPAVAEMAVEQVLGLPDPLLVLVDGAGSFLLVRKQVVDIGRSASNSPADVPLISDLSERHARIKRQGDDYFIHTNKQVNVAGHNVTQKLLNNGDKIVFGRRAKLTFKLPSRKSASAVLDLHDATKMPNDVRRVVLFDRFLTVGRTTNAHIVSGTASEDLLIFERDGRLWIRPKSNGRYDQGQQIEIGRPFELCGVSMVIEQWTPRN